MRIHNGSDGFVTGLKYGIFFFALLLTPQITHAGPGAQALAQFIQSKVITEVTVAAGSLASLMFFYYGFRLIMEANNDSGLTNARQSFIYGIVGALIIMSASAFVGAFYGRFNVGALVPVLSTVAAGIMAAAIGIFTLMIVLAGLQMIASQGDATAYQTGIKRIIYNGMGLLFCTLATVIAPALLDQNSGPFVSTIASFTETLANTIGALSVAAVGFAGVLYIFSGVDQAQQDRAKKILLGTAITLGISIALEALIRTFT